MSSILTNSSALVALQNLNANSRALQTTQERIATGMRVSTAADNAAYWSIAATMRSDNSALSSVKDALGLSSANIDVVSTALKTTGDILSQIKSKLVAARQPGLDRTKVQGEIKQLQDQMKNVADAASFSGQNWLAVDSSATGYNSSKSLVASLTRTSAGLTITVLDVDTSSIKLFDSSASADGIIDKKRTVGATSNIQVSSLDISTLTDSATDQATLENYIVAVDTTFTENTQAASTVGAIKSRLTTQMDFVSGLMDSLTKGVGQLVDADMNQESTRLQALQVQQQLGVQALSIANQSTQQIMSLFK